MNTCILIHFAVGILSAIFGYLLGRLFGKKTCNDCDDCHQKIARLEAELSACKDQKGGTQKNQQLQAQLLLMRLIAHWQKRSLEKQ